MIQPSFPQGTRPALPSALSACCAAAIFLLVASASAQVIVVNSHTGAVTNGAASETSVDRRYQQITPTNVPLPNSELDAKARLELIRLLQAEQGFAMRPLPRGHKGLTLVANGKLAPAEEAYLNMVINQGLSAKPSDRVVITDIRVDHAKLIFDINGGPDKKHRFLSHVQIGVGPTANPVVPEDDKVPEGSRITLVFNRYVPALTGPEVKALLAPLISFDLKTPIQAFTDTLPQSLKDAILGHHVLVGMSTDMLLFAMGQPDHKSREMDGQTPFEEWIYGRPPQEVDFVRVNGTRVIRVEVAKMGETPVIFSKDEVAGLMRTDGTPLIPSQPGTRTVGMGDTEHNPDTQAAEAPPTLRNPGEELPADQKGGVMKPVRFPKPKPDPQPGANPDGEPDAQPSAPEQTSGGAQPSAPDTTGSAPAKPAPANTTQLL
jgi:hypothetical protein